jgi:hypothetical protein
MQQTLELTDEARTLRTTIESTVKLELLLRMVDIDGWLISLSAFIPSAELCHLMGRVDHWVLRHAMAWLQAGLEQGDAPPVAINLSGQSVSDRSFHLWALDELAAAGPAICQRLILVVTKTAVVTNLLDAASFKGPGTGTGRDDGAGRLRGGLIVLRLFEALAARLPQDLRPIRAQRSDRLAARCCRALLRRNGSDMKPSRRIGGGPGTGTPRTPSWPAARCPARAGGCCQPSTKL